MTENMTFEMEVIAQESSRMFGSQRHNKDQDSPSFDLLIKAYDRIRELEYQNQQMQRILASNCGSKRISQHQEQIFQLTEWLKEKDLRIQNLQRINEKVIFQMVKMEKDYLLLKQQTHLQRKSITPVPSQLNSPLNFSKFEASRLENQEEDDYQEQPDTPVTCAKHFLKDHQKLLFSRKENHKNYLKEFTFDKENEHRFFLAPKETNKKILNNCFSDAEINGLLKKVKSRQSGVIQQRKSTLKQFHNYCSSIQKKYSPNAAKTKKFVTLNQKKTPLVLNSTADSQFYCTGKRPSATGNDKTWQDYSTMHTKSALSLGFDMEKSRPRNPFS